MIKKRYLLVLGLAVFVTFGLQLAVSLAQQLPKEIVIGGPISLSGTYAKEGQQGFWGFQAAEKWVNEVYGGVRIGGKKIPIRYKYYDDESRKENVTSLLERLIFPRFHGHKVKLGCHSLQLKGHRRTIPQG